MAKVTPPRLAGAFIVFIVLFVALCLLAPVNAFSQEGPEAALPGDPLYQAKRELERSELEASGDPLKEAAVHTKHAEERLSEIRAVISKGKPEFVGRLAEDYARSVEEAYSVLRNAGDGGTDVSRAMEEVEGATRKHTEVLTDLLQEVPDEARPAISHAIEVSKKGGSTAIDRLGGVQDSEPTAGRPEGPERPEMSDRPGGFGFPGGMGRPGGGMGMPGGGMGMPGGRGR